MPFGIGIWELMILSVGLLLISWVAAVNQVGSCGLSCDRRPVTAVD